MKTPRSKGKELEVRWLDILLMSIATDKWKNIWEVRERISALMPPHALYRKKRLWSRGRMVSMPSFSQTVIGGTIRYAIRNGFIERSVPIQINKKSGNIGNHSLRLTIKGMERCKRIRRYICLSCLHTGITRPTDIKNSCCGHCGRRTLRFY